MEPYALQFKQRDFTETAASDLEFAIFFCACVLYSCCECVFVQFNVVVERARDHKILSRNQELGIKGISQKIIVVQEAEEVVL